MTTVFVVDDHPVVREGMRSMLAKASGIEVIGEAENGLSALEAFKTVTPDVLLLDIRMPGMDGIQLTRRIKHKSPNIKVLILTIFDEQTYLYECIEAGADGYILKNSRRADLLTAIDTVHSGRAYIDQRLNPLAVRKFRDLLSKESRSKSGLQEIDFEILQGIADGLTNREIGERVGLSEIGVKKRLQNIFEKMEASDRAQAVAEGIRRGYIS